MDDSGSDWDSIPDQAGSNRNNSEPPYNFRGVSKEESVRVKPEKVPGNERPKLSETYRPTIKSSTESPSVNKKHKRKLHLDQHEGTPTSNQSQKSFATVQAAPNAEQRGARRQEQNTTMRQQSTVVNYQHADDGSIYGLDNPGFEDVYSLREKPDHVLRENEPNLTYPNVDERIQLLQFEEPAERYFQIKEEKTGTWSDKINAYSVEKCDKCLSECFGFLRIPFVLIILSLGHSIVFVLKAFLRPLSDYVWKPLLVSLHNALCVPLCGLGHHVCLLCSHATAPFCRLTSMVCCPSKSTFYPDTPSHHPPI